MQVLTIEVEKDEDFFTAQCKEHSNCFTQGKTIEEAIHNIKEVLAFILEIKKPKPNVILKDELINAI